MSNRQSSKRRRYSSSKDRYSAGSGIIGRFLQGCVDFLQPLHPGFIANFRRHGLGNDKLLVGPRENERKNGTTFGKSCCSLATLPRFLVRINVLKILSMGTLRFSLSKFAVGRSRFNKLLDAVDRSRNCELDRVGNAVAENDGRWV